MKRRLDQYFIKLGFFLYFVFLICERLYSLLSSFVSQKAEFTTFHNGFCYVIVILSLITTFILLCLNYRLLISPFVFKDEKFDDNDDNKKALMIVGVLLFSGMMNTYNSIFYLQFIAYGFLIVSLLIQFIKDIKSNKENLAFKILTFIYMICFAMGVPVFHEVLNEYQYFYDIFEILALFILIPSFVFMQISLFESNYKRIGNAGIFVLFLILIGLVLIFEASVSLNVFVLIFYCLTIALYIPISILLIIDNRKIKANRREDAEEIKVKEKQDN